MPAVMLFPKKKISIEQLGNDLNCPTFSSQLFGRKLLSHFSVCAFAAKEINRENVIRSSYMIIIL
jgi:hypothetical protein